MEETCVLGQVFHLCRVWGSHHGGSLYSRAIVAVLLRKGWKATVMSEEFCDGDTVAAPGGTLDELAVETPATTDEGEAARVMDQVQRVSLPTFFKRGILIWPRRLVEICKVWKLIANRPAAMVIVQGDLPRIVYLFLQLRVPLIFVRQDGILTCPGNNRFLQRSRSVCRKPLGVSCLLVHRHEGCLGPLTLPHQLGRLAFRIRDRLLLRAIGNFVANSRYIAAIHRKPQRVLYPPRSTSTEDPVAAARHLQRLVFCGRLETLKGPADAIRILSLLPHPFHLEILGDGPERGRLGRLVNELQLEQQVTFQGWVNPARRDKLLASAGALLMPSLWDEAFGMAGLESLAQGTPVVAYDVGGISEWCSADCGRLVPCGDVRAAASAVRELTEDPAQWAIYSEGARRIVANRFPVSRFASELDELLHEVLERFRNPGIAN